MIVFLDTGVLGIITNPHRKQNIIECQKWMYSLIARGVTVLSSDICDYELRRKLIYNIQKNPSAINGINLLNELKNSIEFLSLTTEVMKKAAECWAEVRLQGLPTADEKNIDADMIICAQWRLLKQEYQSRRIVIATTNLRHLNILAEAEEWHNIRF